MVHGSQNTGFVNSMADASLFTMKVGSTFRYVLIYVDDIIVTGNDSSTISQVLHSLADRFSIKDPVDLHYFLGTETSRTHQGLHLSQRKYIVDLLTRTKMLDAKPVSTPLPTTPKLTLHSASLVDNPHEYRSVVASLQYLAFTRSDISFAFNRLSQFMHSPTTKHRQETKRILRYLAGTHTHHLHSMASQTQIGQEIWMTVSTNAYVIVPW